MTPANIMTPDTIVKKTLTKFSEKCKKKCRFSCVMFDRIKEKHPQLKEPDRRTEMTGRDKSNIHREVLSPPTCLKKKEMYIDSLMITAENGSSCRLHGSYTLNTFKLCFHKSRQNQMRFVNSQIMESRGALGLSCLVSLWILSVSQNDRLGEGRTPDSLQASCSFNTQSTGLVIMWFQGSNNRR